MFLKYEFCICFIDVVIFENDDFGVLVSFEMMCYLKKVGFVWFGMYFEFFGCMWLKCWSVGYD